MASKKLLKRDDSGGLPTIYARDLTQAPKPSVGFSIRSPLSRVRLGLLRFQALRGAMVAPCKEGAFQKATCTIQGPGPFDGHRPIEPQSLCNLSKSFEAHPTTPLEPECLLEGPIGPSKQARLHSIESQQYRQGPQPEAREIPRKPRIHKM